MRAFLLGALLALLIVPGDCLRRPRTAISTSTFSTRSWRPTATGSSTRAGASCGSRDVDRDWRPYSQGYWSYTDDYGWYWVSDEPFAWAVFHYGRWTYDEDDGWIWIPDTEWGPAWVTWRWSDDYVGWAPLGPGSRWGPDGELRLRRQLLR